MTYWPLRLEAPLPPALFPPDHLRRTLFDLLPLRLRCAPTTIRQALKFHLKRTSPQGWRQVPGGLDQNVRDEAMAMVFGNSPAARARVGEIEFRSDVSTTRGGRRGINSRSLDAPDTFAELLLLAYREDTGLKALIDWCVKTGVPRPEISKGAFLTAEALRNAWNTDVPGESIDRARVMVLFASLLPPEEANALICAAAELGCSELSMLALASTPETPSSSPPVAPSEPVAPFNLAVSGPVRPRLAALRLAPAVIGAEPEALAILARLTDAAALETTTIARARETWPAGPETVVVDDEAWDGWLTTLQQARAGRRGAASARRAAHAELAAIIAAVGARMKVCVAPEPKPESDADLADRLAAWSALDGRLRVTRPSVDRLRSWAESVGEVASFDNLRCLCDEAAHDAAERERVDAFLTEISAWARLRDTSEVGALLLDATTAELAAIAAALMDEPWVAGSALIVRACLDAVSSEPPLGLHQLLLAPHSLDRRRSLLRFVDPNTSLFDDCSPVRRLVAAERLRDAVTFGPLAQIADPGAGLADKDLVGRTVSQITEMVSTSLDALETGADLLRLARAPGTAPDQQAEAQLIEFARQTPTLSGNFLRLRDLARRTLLLPLVQRGRVDPEAVKDTKARLLAPDTVEDLISRFDAEHPSFRLENRHLEQLRRYLDDAALRLDRFLSATDRTQDPRAIRLQGELANAMVHLRDDGPTGSIEWLEGQVLQLLRGGDPLPTEPTLLGTGEALARRPWSTADNDWLQARLDIPELHWTRPPAAIDCAAGVLRWWSRGGVPDRCAIVAELLARRDYEAALAVAEDHVALAEEVRAAAQPLVKGLEGRLAALGAIESGERDTVSALLQALAFDRAEDELQLLELVDLERTDPAQEGDMSPLQRRHHRLLELAGEQIADRTATSDDLQRLWAGVYARRVDERRHLQVVAAAFTGKDACLEEAASALDAFVEAAEEADRWLSPPNASTFAALVEVAAVKLASWSKSAQMWLPAERDALAQLTRWFLQFVDERARSVHDVEAAGDEGGIAEALDRLLQVSACVEDADRAGACLAQLADTGEIIELPSPLDAAGTDEPLPDRDPRPDVEITPARMASPAGDSAEEERWMPVAAQEAIARRDWRAAGEACRLAAATSDDKSAELLQSRELVFTLLADRGARPEGAVADALPLAATWLAGPALEEARLSQQERLELALPILIAAMAVDAGVSLNEHPGPSSWSDVANASFDRLRGPLAGRVLRAFVNGALASSVADKLWEAATSTTRPQEFRQPLLSFLHEHGAQEAVLWLARRHERREFASGLSQLFDLRAVAASRPDLLPVAEALAAQVAPDARPGPFRGFVRSLPTVTESTVRASLRVTHEGEMRLRQSPDGGGMVDLAVVIKPEGLVPSNIIATLAAEDDVTFGDTSRQRRLSAEPLYFAKDFTLPLRFGPSWFRKEGGPRRESIRVRFLADTLTKDRVSEDVVCKVSTVVRAEHAGPSLNDDTLLELYPGVTNTAVDEAFVGRVEELERLTQYLVAAQRPSPVLLTGMRRVGKTSLVQHFHRKHSGLTGSALTFYLSLAERKVELANPERPVAKTIFNAIQRGLVRQNLPASDHNRALSARIRAHFNDDWTAAAKAIQDCYDEESLSDSLIVLAERVREWIRMGNTRLVLLFDEAEALVVAYQGGPRKKLELEQMLQSLREVSQTSGAIGILISGSNHIDAFKREYTNAFFGSSQAIRLEGFRDRNAAQQLVAPNGVTPYVQFDEAAVDYAMQLCSGMPLFLWQVGATTAFQVRGGPATLADVRAAVVTLVSGEINLPFTAYKILEPIENMLGLELPRERDLLWMLLYRVAEVSSLASPNASVPFVLDQTLLGIDTDAAWKQRLRALVDLRVLRMDRRSEVRFETPLFAEGFRAPRNAQEFFLKQQQVAK